MTDIKPLSASVNDLPRTSHTTPQLDPNYTVTYPVGAAGNTVTTVAGSGGWVTVGNGNNYVNTSPPLVSPGVSMREQTDEYVNTTALKQQLEETAQKYSDLSDKYMKVVDDLHDLIINATQVYDIVTNGKCAIPVLDNPIDVITEFNQYVDEMIADAITREKNELSSWKVESFQHGDVLLFELVPNIDPKMRKEFTQQLQSFLIKNPGVQAIILPNDVNMTHLKENDMNLLGWYKK